VWSYFEVVGIIRDFKYVGDFKLWWKPSKGSLDTNLRVFSVDRDAMELANYDEENREAIHIYVKHIVSLTIEFVEFIGGNTSVGVDGCEKDDVHVQWQMILGVGRALPPAPHKIFLEIY